MPLAKSPAGFLLAATLTLAAGALAQNPPPGRGRGMPGGARFLGAQAGAPGRVVKNAPYAADAVTEITQTLPDGNHIHQVSTSRIYRDTEGRTRVEQSLTGLNAIAPNSKLPTVIFLQDPVAGTSYALDTTRKTATRSAWQRAGRGPGQKGPGGPRPGEDNVKTDSLGQKTMEGLAVDGTRTTMVIAAGQLGNEQPIQIVTERWYSADLQTFVMTRHNDPRAGETVTKLTNVSRAEPAHSLFEVPADFKVVEDTHAVRPPAQSK